MIGVLTTAHECGLAEKRIRAALRDAIRAHQTTLADYYRLELQEVADRRAHLPEQGQP